MGYSELQAKVFINNIAPLMVEEGRKRGYKIISTAIAQAIIEGAAGTSKLAQYHNHWGLKCGSSWTGKSVNMKTKEEYKVGTLTTIKDNFRVYDSDLEGVKGYYDFINTKRYANLKSAKTYSEYATMLKLDGYATSSTYITTLCNTVRKYNLVIYDGVSVTVPTVDDAYTIGKNYTLTSDMYIRAVPNGAKVEFDDITENAKKNAMEDASGFAVLKRKTVVTCLEVRKLTNSTWIRIPSGWICANNSTTKYII